MPRFEPWSAFSAIWYVYSIFSCDFFRQSDVFVHFWPFPRQIITGPSDTPSLFGSIVSVDELVKVFGEMGAPAEYLMPDQVLHEQEETDGGRRQESGKTSKLTLFYQIVWTHCVVAVFI